MASSKQFYMKFNVKDFRTDPKVCACNSGPVGVYIMLMCLLFDNDIKGKHRLNSDCLKSFAELLPRQNVQQTNQQTPQQLFDICCCVAEQLAKHLPFTEKEVKEGLHELLVENVIYLEGNFLCQKRMIKDAKISEIRATSGKKGADATNKKNKKIKKEAAATIPLEDVLPNILPRQNQQQNPNYNSDYNYNSNLEENKGVSNNTSGGMGVEDSGGEGEDLQNEKMYEGNWAYLIPAVFCKHFYFKNNIFGNARDTALKVLSNFYHPPSDLPINEQMENMIERLMLWADEYNELLDRTEQKDSGGRALKTMQGPDCWPNHFHNWLKSQKGRLAKIPDRRIDYQHNGHSNGKLNSTADIDEKIKNEIDPAIRQKLREEKYKIPAKPKKE